MEDMIAFKVFFESLIDYDVRGNYQEVPGLI